MLDTTKAKIEALKANPAETNINFANEELGDEGSKLLVEALADRKLTSLNLGGCGIGSEALNLFKPIIINSTQLTLLNLSKQTVDITLFDTLCKLQTLTLDECTLSPSNPSPTIALNNVITKNPTLKAVSLNKWDLTLDDVKVFFPILQKKIPALSLLDNKFTAQELKTALEKWDKEDAEKKFIKAISDNKRSTMIELFAKYPDIIHSAKSPNGTALQHAIIINAQISTIITLLNFNPNLDGIEELADKHQQKFISQYVKQFNLNTKLEKVIQKQGELINAFIQKTEQEFKSLQTKIEELNAKIKTGQQFFDELLINGAKSGNTDLINTAIKAGANIEALDEQGETPLYLSLSAKHLDTADFLLEQKPQLISKPNQAGQTPLEQIASKDENVETTKWCWTKAAKMPSFNINDEYNKLYPIASLENKKLLATNKLWECVKSGKLQGIKEVLDTNELEIDINALHFENDNETLLFKAVYFKHEDIISYLLQNGADVKIKSHNKATIDEINAEKNASVQDFSETAYEAAITYSDKKLVKIMTSHLLLNACKRGDINDISRALTDAQNILGEESAAILEIKNAEGQTALHLAACNDENTDIMTLLLASLADKSIILETKDLQGRTALHLAVEKENEQVCEMLLNKQADVAAKDVNNRIPLHTAALFYQSNNTSDTNIIKMILHKHAESKHTIDDFKDINNKDIYDLTADKKLLGYIFKHLGQYQKALKNQTASTSLKTSDQGFFSSSSSGSDSNSVVIETTRAASEVSTSTLIKQTLTK